MVHRPKLRRESVGERFERRCPVSTRALWPLCPASPKPTNAVTRSCLPVPIRRRRTRRYERCSLSTPRPATLKFVARDSKRRSWISPATMVMLKTRRPTHEALHVSPFRTAAHYSQPSLSDLFARVSARLVLDHCGCPQEPVPRGR